MISDGYPLVVAMNALLDAIKSISLVINGEVTKATPTLSSEVMPTPGKLVPCLVESEGGREGGTKVKGEGERGTKGGEEGGGRAGGERGY